ncbi:MAG TPA: UDP-3-O-(3-hydroxymyristoyl)glucosamine N-acyltransferase [Burkholderiaceae bacterium]
MGTRLSELVERLGGSLTGDANIVVTSIAPLAEAGAGHITFLTNSKLRQQALASRASAMIVAPADDEAVAASFAGARIVTPNPYAYFARAAQYFFELAAIPEPVGIHPSAVVDPSAQVAASASIGPHVTIEADAVIGERVVIKAGCFIGRGAVLGDDTQFAPNVTFHAHCAMGKRGVVHSGAVIGGDGFGFAPEKGTWVKVPQIGGVSVGDDVDIGSSTCIDRGALADTIIEDGVKLDNQIQIGHNCHIGAHTAMAGCVGVAGSAIIGKHCTFGGAAMVLGHLTIADNVHISSGSMVTRSVLEPGQYTGFYPLAKNADWEKSAVIVRNLNSMREKLRALEKTVAELSREK